MIRKWEYNSYEEYIAHQKGRTKLRRRKKRPCKYYRKMMRPLFNLVDRKTIKTVVCQGVRNDNEVLCMKKLFPCSEVYGTDIRYENLNNNIYCLDFSECPDEWYKKFDVLFSNSIDHSYIGDKILKEWIRITKKYLVLQFSDSDPRPSDPFSIDSKKDILDICNKFGLDVLYIKDLHLVAKIK